MAVTTRDIEYGADGTTMVGRLALPGGSGKRPAVLITHDGPGLTDHQRHRADRLAELGYVAFALDYHGGGRFISDPDEMLGRLGELEADPDRTRAIGFAGLEVLLGKRRVDPSKVAAIGYCFGGTMVLELARAGADLRAIVGFHPGLATASPRDADNITVKVLVCVGSEDPYIPVEQRLAFEEEMRAANVDWRLNLYGGAEHSFTHPRTDPNQRVYRASATTGLPPSDRGGRCSTSSVKCSPEVSASSTDRSMMLAPLGCHRRRLQCKSADTPTPTGRFSGPSSARSCRSARSSPTTPDVLGGGPKRVGGDPPGRTVVASDGPRVLGTAHMGPNRPGPGSHVATASFMVAGEAQTGS